MKLSCFKIGPAIYGIDILLVKEIAPISEIVKIPGARLEHCGLMNLRGNVISLIHPSLFSDDIDESAEFKKQKIIIFKNNEGLKPLIERQLLPARDLGHDLIGLIINEVDDVIEIDKSEIRSLAQNISERLMRVIDGVVSQGNQLISVLSLEKMLKEIHKGVKDGR